MDEHTQPGRGLGDFGDDVDLHDGVLYVGLDLLEYCRADVVLTRRRCHARRDAVAIGSVRGAVRGGRVMEIRVGVFVSDKHCHVHESSRGAPCTAFDRVCRGSTVVLGIRFCSFELASSSRMFFLFAQ